MKRFHVIIKVDDMPLQFDVSEMASNGDLVYQVTTANHGTQLMHFDSDRGEYFIIPTPDTFWQRIERELGYKIQFENGG